MQDPPRSAAQWFALMHGAPDATQRAAFERWRAAPANAEAYDHLVRTWDQSMFVAHLDVAKDRDLARAAVGPALRRGAIAAGVAILFAFGALVAVGWPGGRAPSPRAASATQVVAGPEGIRALGLADGSHLLLDRNSAVMLHFDASQRRVRLERGRVRFDVARDPARPFIVQAGDSEVMGSATLFDVAVEGKAVRVALLRGAVEVRGQDNPGAHSRPRRLVAGQQVQLGEGAAGRFTGLAPADLEWPRDMIGFEAVPLRDAVEAFNRTSPRPVRLGSQVPRTARLTGAFRRGDPVGFAQAVAATFGLGVRSEGDGAVLIQGGSAGSEKNHRVDR